MFRTTIVLLLGLCSIPGVATAQDYPVASDYFLICLRETDMFVMAHTWEYYGYDEFLRALDYYVFEKHYGEEPACGELHGIIAPNAEGVTTTVILEGDYPIEEGDSMRMYLWMSDTPDGVFTVLSTTLPIE